MRRTAFFVSLLLTALCTVPVGCAKPPPPKLSAAEFDAKGQEAYEKALEKYHDRDWVNVPILMAEVKREYAGTRWARLAQLRIADAHFHQRSYPEAITAYREFLREFPNDAEVPYARYKVAECQFESRGDGLASPPLEERDLVNVRDADRSISEFLKDYPDYKERERLLYMQKWVRGMLARHELYVARYYLEKDRLGAAVARAEYALLNYQDTGLEPEALVLLGETHMKRHEPAEAAAAFQLVLDKYEDSPFTVPARRFLEYLHQRGMNGTGAAATTSSPAQVEPLQPATPSPAQVEPLQEPQEPREPTPNPVQMDPPALQEPAPQEPAPQEPAPQEPAPNTPPVEPSPQSQPGSPSPS